MKAIWLALGMMLLLSRTLESTAQAQPPEIPFDSVPDFLHLPADLYFGEVAGIAVNSKGHVFVLSRGNTTGPAYGAAAAQLIEFDADGKFLREIGHNLYAWSYAHAVRVDRDDNIWVADKGSDVVVRFNPRGQLTMVFGRKAEASDESAHPLEHPKPPRPPIDGMFRQVTDMSWDSAGNIYISDGYINSRVAKFDREGNWVGTWGEPGSGPGQFNTLHAIVTDHEDRIYVADRGNARIQVFDTTGKLLSILRIDVPAPHDAPPRCWNIGKEKTSPYSSSTISWRRGQSRVMKSITCVSNWSLQLNVPIYAMASSACFEPSGTGQGTGCALCVVWPPFSRRTQSSANGASLPSACSIASK